MIYERLTYIRRSVAPLCKLLRL